MASPICTVNGNSTINGVNVAANSSVTIAIADTAGVKSWRLSCVSTDELHAKSTIDDGLTINQITKQATFTSPNVTTGAALIFESEINGGLDVNGRKDPALSTRFGVYVLTSAGGLRVAAFDETFEGSAMFGWTAKFNAAVRAAGSAGVSPALSGTLPIVVNNSNPVAPVVSINAATTSNAGSMSASDKTKLDSVSSGARVASVSGSSPITIGGTSETPIVQLGPASNSSNGYMSEADKVKLDALSPWTQTALLTANHTAVAWQHVLVDFGGASGDITISLPASSLPTKNARVKISEVSADGGVGSGYALKVSGAMATTAGGVYSEPPYIVANDGFGSSKVGAWIELLDTGAGWLPVGIGCVP